MANEIISSLEEKRQEAFEQYSREESIRYQLWMQEMNDAIASRSHLPLTGGSLEDDY